MLYRGVLVEVCELSVSEYACFTLVTWLLLKEAGQ